MTALSPSEVAAALVGKGLCYASWARLRGYQSATVRRTVTRWVGTERTRTPQGPIARRILADLSRDLGVEIVPGILDPIHAARQAA